MHLMRIDKEILENGKNIIQIFSNRVGHHSTSDDSTAYRSTDEINQWTTHDYPTTKFKAFLTNKGYWNGEMDEQFSKEARKNVLSEFSKAEKRLKPAWTEMFKDVYKDVPAHIK